MNRQGRLFGFFLLGFFFCRCSFLFGCGRFSLGFAAERGVAYGSHDAAPGEAEASNGQGDYQLQCDEFLHDGTPR